MEIVEAMCIQDPCKHLGWRALEQLIAVFLMFVVKPSILNICGGAVYTSTNSEKGKNYKMCKV